MFRPAGWKTGGYFFAPPIWNQLFKSARVSKRWRHLSNSLAMRLPTLNRLISVLDDVGRYLSHHLPFA